MTGSRTVHLVVPEGIEDPLRPSGGNTYDRQLRQELAARGWAVPTRAVAGDWPRAGEAARRALEKTLGAVPSRSLVLVDGLVASAVPEILVPACRRLRVVVLLHLPAIGRDGSRERECAVLDSAAAVVTTSDWTRRWVLATYGLDPARVHVARPGAAAADSAAGSADGRNLLCVGAVAPGKGQDVLLAALARITDRDWRCLCVGALTPSPDFVAELRHGIGAAGLDDRFVLAGPRTGGELEASYGEADAVVLASRGETYGMVVTEALARGLPVIASHVGGLPEALGRSPNGRRPGLLLPPGDVEAWADTLRRWLCDPILRHCLRDAARHRRAGLAGWSATAERVAEVLVEVAA